MSNRDDISEMRRLRDTGASDTEIRLRGMEIGLARIEERLAAVIRTVKIFASLASGIVITCTGAVLAVLLSK